MRIAQITDIHMIAGAPEPGGYDPAAALDAVLAAVMALSPDVVLLTGDLAANGLPEEYRRLRAALAGVTVPILAVPGNHDARAVFLREMSGEGIHIGAGPALNLAYDAGPMRLIGLDTLAPDDGAASGVIGEAQLAWVAERLAEADPRPILVFLHHPPFALGLAMDWTRCVDGDALGRLIVRHEQVLGVVCGHVHREARLGWGGTVAGVCPAVAWEIPFGLGEDEVPYLVPRDPAFQLHILDPAYGLVTHTQSVTLSGGSPGFSVSDGAPSIAAANGNRR